MRTLVIDDEELARRRVVNLLKDISEIDILGECSTGKAAIKQINELKPQLIFLDVNMKDMNGFEVLQKINVSPKPIVVFVTAYDHYASRAFDVDAFDFLLKPFKDDRFFKTIKKVLDMSRSEAEANFEKRVKDLFKIYSEAAKNTTSTTKIPVKQGNKTILINPFDILYIVASGYYAEIYTREKKYLLRESMQQLDKMLDDNIFFRVHRSAILNLNHVKEIVHSDFAEIDAKMADDKLLHISKANKKQFLERVGIV